MKRISRISTIQALSFRPALHERRIMHKSSGSAIVAEVFMSNAGYFNADRSLYPMCRELTLCYTVAMSDRFLAQTLLSITALLVTLAGCTSTQEVEDRQALTFLQVKATPDSFKGQSATFGGKVLTARRQKDSTRIEILQLPLDRSLRPGYDLTQSQGRFIALQREFLDPATLPPGTRVTVTGEISGSITLPLDETDYTYPVIDIKRVQVWPGSEDMIPRIRPYMGPGPYWGPYWSPYWRPWPYW